jgi:hypothetical protein
LTEDELNRIRQLAGAATPGPWYVRMLDDDYAAGFVAVSTSPDTGRDERWPRFDHGSIVAATLVQNPERYVDIADGRWDENAAFIAAAREAVPRLLDEVERLRRAISHAPDQDTPEPS